VVESHGALPPPPTGDVATMALFIDVDGTLVDFAERPDAVVVDPRLRETLHVLRMRLEGALAPISGRPLHEIDALTGSHEGAAAGLHGAEIRHADGAIECVATDRAQVQRLHEHAAAGLADATGVLVEAKPNGVALHWRRAPEQEARVRAVVAGLAHDAGAAFVQQPGNHVIELKPAGIDKGAAVRTLMRSAPFAGRRPWVLGDDLTDEHAFEAVNEQGGVSVVVGTRRPTAAMHALADPAAARAWLVALSRTPAHRA
jgi:trehalose 6-phosphate phosphatase